MVDVEFLPHIKIEREDIERPLRGRQNPMAPRVRIRENTQEHARNLAQQVNSVRQEIADSREALGIDPDRLIVLEFNVLSVNQRDLLQRSFSVAIVEEIEIESQDETCYRLLVQFPTRESLQAFEDEREYWFTGHQDRTLLTYAQRRDLFNALDMVRQVNPEDRMGQRLRQQGIPETPTFLIDIDLWYDGSFEGYRETELIIRNAINTLQGRLLNDLFRTPSLLLGKAEVNMSCLEHLLNLDIVANIDLPVEPMGAQAFELSIQPQDIDMDDIDEDAPLVTVIDSGVFSGHPLLRNRIVVEERDFYTGEDTVRDLNGHGTGVAGIIVYGDIAHSLVRNNLVPKVKICSAKVMKNDPVSNSPVFPENQRPEQLLEQAIRHFYEERDCRVFNISIGHAGRIYNGGRQFPWAEMLDNLSRELDIVIVISAGNHFSPDIPQGINRDDIYNAARDQLLLPEHALIEPGTASICLVVGSITRREDPYITPITGMPRLSVTPVDGPSIFTRTGFGVGKAIKPDLVSYGGNYSLQQIAGRPSWVKQDPNLGEPTLRHIIDDGRWYKAFCGTSLAAPHVTHHVALIENALRLQLGIQPSANLTRAMTVNSASLPNEIENWLRDANDINDNRQSPRRQEKVLRIMGYGKPHKDISRSFNNQVTLFAEDELQLNSFHIYVVPIPLEFLQSRSNKEIAISLAYDPPVRLSRKDYIATKMWFEVYRGLTPEQVENFRRSRQRGDDEELPSVPQSAKADFTPGYQILQNSTVQLRKWKKGVRGGNDLNQLTEGAEHPSLTILVTGKEQYPHPEGADSQRYAIVITFYIDNQELNLYNLVEQRVRARARARIRRTT